MISVPATLRIFSLCRRLMFLTAGLRSTGGVIISSKNWSATPDAQLISSSVSKGQAEVQSPHIVAQEHLERTSFFNNGIRSTSQVNCFGVIITDDNKSASGWRLTIPIKWFCTIRLPERSICFQSSGLIHHLFHTLHTPKHRARSADDR